MNYALDPVAAVRHNVEAFNARDFESVLEAIHEDWRCIPGPGWIYPGTSYRGHDGYRTMLAHLGLPGAELELDVEVRRVEQHVLTTGSVTVRSADGDSDDRPVAWLHTVIEGRLRWSRGFADERGALEAVRVPIEAEVKLAFDAAPDALVLLDNEARILRVNRAATALLGHPAGELHGVELIRFIPPELRDRALDQWRHYKPSGRASGVGSILAPEGPVGPLEFRLVYDFIPGRHLLRAHRRDAGMDFDGWNIGLLTPRQRQVLGLLASGLTGPETAERLYISPATVRTHVQNAREALGTKTSTQAVAEALIRGEIDWPSTGGR